MTDATSDNKGVNRRRALMAAAMAGAIPALARPANAYPVMDGSRTGPEGSSTPHSAIVKTRYGKVRGYIAGDVFTFKGVPYGDTTGGDNRWLPAKAPKSWDDDYLALAYGANCPQTLHDFRNIPHTFL